MAPINHAATSVNPQTPPSLTSTSVELIKKGVFSMCTGIVTVAICNQVNTIYHTPAENFLAWHTTPEEYNKYLALRQDDSMLGDQAAVLSLVIFAASVGPGNIFAFGKYLCDRACSLYGAATR